MNYIGIVILSCSIFLPASIAAFRFSKIDPLCRPFIYCLWIGSLNELIGFYASHRFQSTAISNNVYVLLEALLLVWQCWNWNAFDRKKTLYIAAISIITSVWIVENSWIYSLHETQPWFRLFYSFAIVLAAINILNKLISAEKNALLRHPIFILCSGIIFFFTYKLIVEACWLAELYATPGFMLNIYAILMYINCIANIIYAIGLLWMPGKLPFSLPY